LILYLGGSGETDISAEKTAQKKKARLSQEEEHKRRTQNDRAAPEKRA
jgi:hypothetical protein